jgi:hypothetical protein
MFSHQTLEAAFKEYWEANYPACLDPVIHEKVREAFLCGCGHVAFTIANMGHERGLLAVSATLYMWNEETRRFAAGVLEEEEQKTPQRPTQRVPLIPGSKTPGKA